MKLSIVIYFLINNFSLVISQGKWGLGYISIDSIQESGWVNKEIRLDFKSSKSDSVTGNIDVFKIRDLLFKKDTISLEVHGRNIDFIENWKLYVDHGILDDQTLLDKNKSQVIKEQFIKSINDSVVLLKVNFYEIGTSKKMLLQGSKLITINKKIIKGVLFKRYY